MRKYLLIILSFVFQYFALSADNYTYCYWVDDNHAAAKTTTLTTNKLNVTMDVSSLSPGMHTLFVRAKKNNGGWTSPRASHFFKMLNPATVKTYYWFDDNDSTRFEVAKVNGETFMIDVSHLSVGVHTLHVRMEGTGATSTTVSSQFLKFTGNFDAYYWFDDETERREFTNAGGNAVLIDVSHLKDGLHSFNAMLVSDNGTPSMPVSRTFIKMPQPTENDSTTLTFWIDGAEYTQQKVAYGNDVVDFELDVDTLGVGMHFLQVQAVTNSGSASNIASGYFMRMPGANNDGVMAYRYWVNDDNADLAFTSVENPTLPYEFIGDLDVTPQPLRCARFHFEVNDNQPMLYAVNDVTVQFFSVGGQLINAKKEFVESIAADTLTADEWTVINNDTVIKANTPTGETIYWYAMNLEEGDTACIKTNYSSTLQVFSHSGNKVFESKTDSSLVFRQFVADKAEAYYLALHTVNTTKAQVTLTVDLKEFIRYFNVETSAIGGGTVTAGGIYPESTELTLTATPSEGYHFVKWSDGVTDATRTIVVASNMALSAEFAINVYTIAVSAENGTITGAGEYAHGTEVTLNATPNAGYHFVKWSDGDVNATRTITVTADVTLTAEFAINVYNVALSAENGTVTGAGSYNHGTEVTLTATPNEGYHFVKWSDGDVNATRTITVTADVTLTAEFAINVYNVTLSAENGTVIGAGSYNHGTEVTLTATPNEGYHFVKWSDGDVNATRTITVTADVTLTAEFAINVYTVAVSAENGTVTGAGEYNHGTEVTLTATPNEGYHFVKWSDGETNATRTIIVTADVTLTAEFAINVYNVALSTENGTVTGAGEYAHGTEVTLTATPNEGYHFVKWSDGDVNATRTIIVTANVTLTAEFAINGYTVTLSAENGIVTGAGSYNHGTEVTLTATPNEGYHFVKWSDGDVNATRTITVTADVTLTAEFAINGYTVTLSAENGTVTGAGSYNHGTEVTLTATPNEGYHFVKWSDGETNATRTITVTSDVTLTAEFAINVYDVTLSAENGMVTGAGEYAHGTEVTLTATPNEGYHFVKWSDGDVNATRTITMTDDVTLTAEFAINVYDVALSAENGTVTGAGEYAHGTEVTLTATPNEGYHFVKWSDGETNATRTITVTADVTLTAEFAINVYDVTLSAENGIVTGAGSYNHGTEVTLTATPNEGYHFVKWSDGDVNATRTITVTADVTLTAEFAINVYDVTVSAENGIVTGAGEYAHGTEVTLTATPNEGYHFVKWSDGEINATRTITVTADVTLTAEFAINVYNVALSAENGTVTGAGEYAHGTEVTLTATPNEGYHFVKWSDGETNATRTITVTADVTLTAEFAINVYDVTLSAENGIVTGAGSYNHGTKVTLTATPNEGYHFVKWSDGETNATRTITVTADVTLTAEFAINGYTVTLSAENGTVTGAGEYAHGTEVTLTATPNEGYHFVKWSDGETNATRTITVTSDVTLTAEFAINVYTVTLSADEDKGRVVGTGSYSYGETVTIVALANEHYHFVKWSDGDENDVRVITITADIDLTAEFAPDMYELVLNVDSEEGRVIGAGLYEYGKEVTIVAIPNAGYHFVKWSDGDENDVRTIVIESNITLTAEFASNESVDVDEIKESSITAYSHNQTLYVEGISGDYYVLDMTGNVVYYGQSSIVPLPCGVYMIVANGERHKVMIR